mgnify:CR=1 FL=1
MRFVRRIKTSLYCRNLSTKLQKTFFQYTGGPKIIGHPPAFEFKIIFYFQNMMLLASCFHACVHIFMQYLHLSFIILSLTIQMINKAKRKKLPSQNYRTPLSFLNSIILSYASNNVTHTFSVVKTLKKKYIYNFSVLSLY